jgi:putative photosynthetic complex assembly protein
VSRVFEHNEEPSPGLPAALPGGERVLWRGRPGLGRLAVNGFQVRKLALYFALLLVAHLILQVRGGESVGAALTGMAGYGLLALSALAVIVLYAWLSARATLYTITSERVVIRCGVALPVSINLPFAVIASADLRRFADGAGDIALTSAPGQRASYLLLWPHLKMRRLFRVQPMLRAVPDVEEAARVLGAALTAQAEASLRETGVPPAHPAEPEPAPAEDAATGRRWAAYPTLPLAGAVALVVIAVVSVTLVRLVGPAAEVAPVGEVVSALDLRFEDGADGSVTVYEARSGERIKTIQPGEDGFVRATLRSLANARRQTGAGPDEPFSLLTTREGRLLLTDDVTGRVIDLWAFGKTNARAFSQFFSLAGVDPRPPGDELAAAHVAQDVTALAQTRQEARP